MMNANHPPYTPNTNNNQLPSLPLNFSTIDYKTLGQATQYSAEAEAAKRIIQRLIEDYSRVFKTTKMIYDKEFGTLFNGLFVILKDILFAYGIGKGISRKLTTHQERKELVDKFLNLVFEKLSEEIPETEGAHNSSDLINSDQLSEETTEKKFINDFLKHIQHNFLTLQTDPNAVKTSIENRKNELQKAIGEKIKWIIEIILSYGFPTWSTPFIIAGAGGIYQLSKQIYEEKGVGNFGLPQTYQNLLGTFSVTKQFFFQAKPVNQLKEYLTTSFTKILNHEETKLRFDTIYDATTETNIQNNIILYQEILNLTHDVHEEFDSNSPVFFTYLHRLNLIEDLHTRLSGLLENLSKVEESQLEENSHDFYDFKEKLTKYKSYLSTILTWKKLALQWTEAPQDTQDIQHNILTIFNVILAPEEQVKFLITCCALTTFQNLSLIEKNDVLTHIKFKPSNQTTDINLKNYKCAEQQFFNNLLPAILVQLKEIKENCPKDPQILPQQKIPKQVNNFASLKKNLQNSRLKQ